MRGALQTAAAELGVTTFTLRFLASEWLNAVDAWQVTDATAYQGVPRLGRKNRLRAKQRATPVFERARALLGAQGLLTWPMIFVMVTGHFSARAEKPFTHTIVDEAQDLRIPEFCMLAAITPAGPDTLFLPVTSVSASFRNHFLGRLSV